MHIAQAAFIESIIVVSFQFFVIINIILLSCAQKHTTKFCEQIINSHKIWEFYYSKPIANQPLMRKCYDNIAEYWMNHMHWNIKIGKKQQKNRNLEIIVNKNDYLLPSNLMNVLFIVVVKFLFNSCSHTVCVFFIQIQVKHLAYNISLYHFTILNNNVIIILFRKLSSKNQVCWLWIAMNNILNQLAIAGCYNKIFILNRQISK